MAILPHNTQQHAINQGGNIMKTLLAITAAVAITAMAGSAFAADTTSANLNVKASVSSVCVAVAGTEINFGTLDPIDGPPITTASLATGGTAGVINVKCTQDTGYTLSTPATATIANGATTIVYTPSYSGATNSGTVAGADHTIDASVNKTAYATAPTGAYTGTLTVTVTY